MRKLYLLLLGVVFAVAPALAQRTLTGKVSDEKGNPVANASVVVKGTTSGTTTKADGTYSLSLPANAQVLVEAYTSPIDRIRNLPVGMGLELQRVVAGKRLLLFSLLARADGDLPTARRWLAQAMQIAGDDPEVVFYGRQLAAESQRR